MLTVAIIGAGDLGGAIAQALAARDRISRVLLVDAAASVAAGKALDIRQMGAVHGFHTQLDGTAESSRIAGCSVCVVADRFGKTATEWQGDEGLTMLTRLVPLIGGAPIVFAGASQAQLLRDAVREGGVPRARAVGSAPEAFRSAVAAIVAVEAGSSAGEVLLTVLGAPGGFVVPWSEASIGGYSLERVLSQVQLRRVEARVERLWPPAAYALGTAAARVTEAIVDTSRKTFSVLTMLGGELNVKDRVSAIPALLAPTGIVHTRVPTLSTRERVRLDTVLGA
jgi:malate dehydrogenase